MNLFYKPTLSELAKLIDQVSNTNIRYNVIVDYDGEVLLDSNSQISTSLLSKFKFYINGLTWNQQLKKDSKKYLKFLNQLYVSLLFCWEQNIAGEIDYPSISEISLHNRLQ